MRDPNSVYQNPLSERYASEEMLRTFSADERYGTWRRLWIALAEAQSKLGLPVTARQIEEMKKCAAAIDYQRVAQIEKDLRHDVMAHITAFAECCPSAKPIIHLGATSAYVTDNTDLILMRKGLEIIREKIGALLDAFRDFALAHKDLPALSYTHLQPAQLTTVGKRAALWAQDFAIDFAEVSARISGMRFRGVKGTTGTQASFLSLFGGDSAKVEELDQRVTEAMGFRKKFTVTGQTYTRKVDDLVLHALAGIAQSAHKFSNDARILQGFRELEEPFEEKQVGSSAMPYKRNPMRLERISSLAKLVLCEAQNPAWVQATQWLERTLDDSANRRISIPQTFLAADAILILSINVVRGLRANRAVIRARIDEELPFMASEDLLVMAVKEGGDRQALHERIRVHAMEAVKSRREGGRNDLLERLAGDPAFEKVRARIPELAEPSRHVGRSAEQVEAFFREEVAPLLDSLGPVRGSRSWEVRV